MIIFLNSCVRNCSLYVVQWLTLTLYLTLTHFNIFAQVVNAHKTSCGVTVLTTIEKFILLASPFPGVWWYRWLERLALLSGS